MATTKKKSSFYDSEVGAMIKQALIQMASDTAFNTESTYSANAEVYPDNLIPFVDKHMNYLCAHPAVDPQYYVSNLRLMTRLK